MTMNWEKASRRTKYELKIKLLYQINNTIMTCDIVAVMEKKSGCLDPGTYGFKHIAFTY